LKDISEVFSQEKRYKYLLLSLLGAILILRFLLLGAYPLLDNTEARYAEIGREMLASGDWITPQIERGDPFWGKPPLLFWLTALSYKIFGINEIAARLPSFISAVLMIVLTYLLSSTLYNIMFGLIAGIILLTSGLFFSLSGTVIIDPLMALMTTLSLSAFIITLKAKSLLQQRIWAYLFFIGLGLNLLSKGPIGCVVTLFPILLWTVCYRKSKIVINEFPWVTGMILVFIISVPWHLMAEWRTPGFLEYYIVGEHWQRFTVKGWDGDLYGGGHPQPLGTIWILAMPALLPWLILLIYNVVRLREKRDQISKLLKNEYLMLFIMWFLTPLFIFSISTNILMTYVAPCLPPFAVLTTYVIWKRRAHEKKTSKLSLNSPITALCLILFVPISFLIASLSIMPHIGGKKSQKSLILAFLKHKGGQQAELLYTRRLPFSARFYAQGEVNQLIYETPSKILDELYDDNLDYYAIRDDNIVKFPDEAFKATVLLGRFGNYQLRKESTLNTELTGNPLRKNKTDKPVVN